MTCRRIREINVAAFLADPRASEHRSFLAHYPTCTDCSTELEDWTRLERVVREATSSTHPAGAQLLAYRRAPESLTGAQREEVARQPGSRLSTVALLGAVPGSCPVVNHSIGVTRASRATAANKSEKSASASDCARRRTAANRSATGCKSWSWPSEPARSASI